ncbi:MAG: ABC transporter ATP-binding protein [Solirubrobacteraceae bacterium]
MTNGNRESTGAAGRTAVIGPGEIVLEDAWRRFAIGGDPRRTLKELFTRRTHGPLDHVQALAGVTIRVGRGETVGIVGRNGAGKTSTLRLLAGIVPLDRGRAECGGRIATLIELGAGFGREFTGRENILLNGALNGLGKRDIEDRLDDIIAFSELGHFVDVPVKAYSSGMLVRLGFSIAAHLDADVLLIDEVLAVGDEAFQRKCMRKIAEVIEGDTTVVLVSHAPSAIERTCERVVVLDAGRAVFDGPTAEGLLFYHELLGTETGAGGTERRNAGQVEEVELRDADGRRRTVFAPGEPLRIEVNVAGAGRLELALRDAAGQRVFSAATEVEAAGWLVYEIPRLHLLGGDYDLALTLGSGDIDRLVGFSVAATPGAEGVADLRGTWTARTPVTAP